MSEQNTERDDLQRFQDIIQMSGSTPFQELKALIEGIVSEAHEAIVGCISMDPNVRMGLSMRYQQRLAVQREINNWIESAQKGYEEITERMRQELDGAARRSELV